MMQPLLQLSPPPKPIAGTYFMPGSKSLTNRALVSASLASGTSLLREASPSDDSVAMMAALEKLGVPVTAESNRLRLTGGGGTFTPFAGTIDVGPAGTTMRFLASLCAIADGCEVILQGTERMHQRPIGPLVDALRSLGAQIEYLGRPECPPLRIRGNRLRGGTVKMDGGFSSQYFTALLLCAPALPDGLTIVVGREQISRSYIDMTIDGMRAFGVSVQNEEYRRYVVPAGARYRSADLLIEGDASGASYLWALAALSGGSMRVENLRPDSPQGDARFPALLEQMGCEVLNGNSHGISWIEVRGGSELQGITADMTLMPDTAQTLAVLGAAARGVTYLTGLSTLKHKETDRLLAMKTELAKLGVRSEITDESITVWGGSLQSPRLPDAEIDTYEDHRMAMSFAVLSARYDGLRIREPHVVTKSFPAFWEVIESFGVRVQ